MKSGKLFLLLFILSMSRLTAQTPEYHLLIGTYTGSDKPNGIHVYRFNTQTGEFNTKLPLTELANASYIAVSKDRRNVYAVSEGNGGGSVNAYAFDPSSGSLKFLNSAPAMGPCYVSVDGQKKIVFTGNYGGGSVLASPLNNDGSLSEDKTQAIRHEGSSVVTDRQNKPHVHSVVLSPDDQYLFVPDLGIDKVVQYRINAGQQQILQPANVPFLAVSPGGGPRHLTFHPNGKNAYLVLELTGSVLALDYSDGKLAPKQTISMAPGTKEKVSGADIHVSPDGKFLYASNRGDVNEVAIFSIDKKGSLKLVNRQSVLGKTPRNFAIDPTGNFLLVANQNTNDIVIFKRDKKTGLLTPTGKKIEVEKPVCLKFVAIGE